MDPNQIYRQHETEKKNQYASRILEAQQVEWRWNLRDIIVR